VSAICAYVPFTLRSINTTLLPLNSMRAYRREARPVLDDVIVLGTSNRNTRAVLIHQQLAVVEAQAQTHAAFQTLNPRQRLGDPIVQALHQIGVLSSHLVI
jgi:hypothetical protein